MSTVQQLSPPVFSNEDPIREELFSVERLEQYAAELAAEHSITPNPRRGRRLLPRLEENGRRLVSIYRVLADAMSNDRMVSPAAEWLVDNFHIIEDQLREIRHDLPKGYYRELPKLAEGLLQGYPRVYAIALALIAHTDSRLDPQTLARFIRAYQHVAPLSIGELWAIAITLRVALVENLTRLAIRIAAARRARDEADKLAERLLETAGREPEQMSELLEAAMGKAKHLDRAFIRAFIVQLAQRLRDQDPEVWPALDWIEQQLVLESSSIEQTVHAEHQRQAAAQATVGNIITSMRLLSTLEWKEFFESVSQVDPILATDPAGAYPLMDFETRDRYRHVVEKISKRTRSSEQDIARHAISLAERAKENDPNDTRRAHVGYYLVDRGRSKFEEEVHYRPRLYELVPRAVLKHPTAWYLGTLTVMTALFLIPFLWYAYAVGASPAALLAIALLIVVPVSDFVLSALNLDVTLIFRPTPLPKMNTESGTPEHSLTFVVIPTILNSEETVRSLLENIEVQFLANRDDNIYFALLGDFADSASESMEDDDRILEAAAKGIEGLNYRYKEFAPARFYLFQRHRLWNAAEGKWMGWERKRGKLHEFNRLLRGANDTSYIAATTDPAFLARVRFVITLDSDTQLPRDSARRLIGTALHPLNHARIDPILNRVTEGYGILQPRVSMTLESSSRSLFARIFSGHTGVDPYTTAVSDVYQDLFGEGNYTGKGLYDVDAFEAALAGRVPENLLLSHDLFESLYARAALATDVEFLDDYPSQYDSYARRQHRWTRGDWQIARWIFPRIRDERGRPLRNQLPLISRWKIVDNLRRSMVAPALLLWLAAAWAILPGSAALWTFVILVIIAFPVYAHVTNALLLHPRGIPWTSHFWSIWGDIRTNTAQVALSFTFIAHQAYLQVDAILLTFYRKLISKKKLLEWVTAAEADRGSAHDLKAYWQYLWPTEVLTLGVALLVMFLRPGVFGFSTPFLVVWAASPLIAHWVSRRLELEEEPLSSGDERLARLVSRRTWKFFETFIGPEDNWLPPDNYQEDPRPVIAHRTSPTDVGMLLLSTAAARDFGYIGTLEFVERVELTFATMEKLDRFNGHLLNWYDTRTLAPLYPQYVSTVDSGNLAGELLVLKQVCTEAADRPVFDRQTIEGLIDTIALMKEAAAKIGGLRQSTRAVTLKQLRAEIELCATRLSDPTPDKLSAWHTLFLDLSRRAVEIEDIVNALSHEHGVPQFEGLISWIQSLIHQLREHRRDLAIITPWSFAVSPQLDPAIVSCSEETAVEWEKIIRSLDHIPTLEELPFVCDNARSRFLGLRKAIEQCSSPKRQKALRSLDTLIGNLEEASQTAAKLVARYADSARRCEASIDAMDFRFLYDEERKVFIIGYNVSDGRRDNSYYDLLASEARLASFIAIAKGDVPQEHWFHLGRGLTKVDGHRALISWTATMFEYLMPLLVMRGYPDTLLDQTHRAIVKRQIEYGRENSVPWGVSEAAYNARDLQLNYQYGPFGIPGLGLKRGLSDDLVVSPYSTALAALVDPRAALENMRRLEREGALTQYGFYESIDYTTDRLQPGQNRALIKAFMAHHQGMIVVALDNLVNDSVMQRRFHSEPLVQATELLLQERIPQGGVLTRPRQEEVRMDGLRRINRTPDPRRYDTADLPTPRIQLLSNGEYSVVITTAGAGRSTSGGIEITRWREDVTRDHWGSFCYLRDVRSGAVWSAGTQPIRGKPQSYEVALTEEKAEFRRTDAGIVTRTEIIVSPEDNTELRRIRVTNTTNRSRHIELTSYLEVVLAPRAADAAHPAFSNLFVQTEFITNESGLLATRRRRSVTEQEIWGFHVVVVDGEAVGAVQYETDRARFIGRGHTTANPVAVMEGRPLSNTVGAVLDPIFSLRRRVRLAPNETAAVTFATGIAHSREEALRLADKYHNPYAFEREAGLAWTRAQVEMRHLQMDADEAHLFQRLAGRLLYCDPSLRPRSHVLAMNTKDQSGLWAYGISGDLPIVLVRISEEGDLKIVRQLLRGHEYLRLKGLVFDLVILNDHPPSYVQLLQDEIQRLVRASGSQALIDKPGGVFLRRSDIMPDADRILLHAAARVVIVADRGRLDEQLVQRPFEEDLPARFIPRTPTRAYPTIPLKDPGLAFFNGLGGFTEGGKEYGMILSEGQWTPAPWLNVISNSRDFGFQVSESGAGYTWSINSRENRLTPWSNDPISDPPGEAIYLRDEDTGEIWTTTPLPIRDAEPYVVRHGQGYSIFEHGSHGIYQELLMFVPMDAPIKISILRLHNKSERKRRISVTSYAELVLGIDNRMAPFIITELDKETGAIIARNPYNNEFGNRVAFIDISERERTFSCDRKEFLGRNRSAANPAALGRVRLSGRVGAGLDPCAAMQTIVDLAPGEERRIVVLIGQAESVEEARTIAGKYKRIDAANNAIEEVRTYWEKTVGTVQVKTPDTAMDIMLNRWLIYQTLACRVWARSAFYQSGGAYGFRDQLQDVCALVYAEPSITRAQILRAAARQFREGDVQHWWHPPTGRGVRTRCSDDLLFLPFVTSFYLARTGDTGVLDESVPFLDAPALAEDQVESYTLPAVAAESASIYEHCTRAIDRSLAVGEHGLPLMGSGDWNDGMNEVGHQGKGESIWLGWFLYKVLMDFSGFCDARKEKRRGNKYRARAEKLKQSLEENGWDGDWYRRAYFDDGTPLGSAQNEECRIDSIAQSWGVISGAADHHRAVRGMTAVEEYLIRRGDALAILFTPPFDKSALDPGYIKGYVPGVRENGGQYTHAAVWTLIAYAMLDDGDRAGELFAILNPINHSSTRAGLHKYRVEPYVVAADVYAVWPHTGRGGWTWYTGSASWMYRAGLEWILGFNLRGDKLKVDPCIPRGWREYEITYTRGSSVYYLTIENPHGLNRGVPKIELDENPIPSSEIALVDDGKEHVVRITLEAKPNEP